MMHVLASLLRRLRSAPAPILSRPVGSAERNPAGISIALIWALVAQLAIVSTVFHNTPASALVSSTSCGAFGTGVDFGDIKVKPLHGKAFYTDLKNGVNASYVGYEIVNDTGANLDNIWVQIDDFRAVTGTSVLNLANSADSALPVTPSDTSTQPVGRIAAGASSFVYFLVKASDVSANAQRHDIHIFRGDPNTGGSRYAAGYDCYYELSGVKRTLAASANKVTQVSADTQATIGGVVTVTVKGATGTAGAGDGSLDGDSMWLSPASSSAWPTRALRLESVSIVVKYKKNDPAAQWATFSNSLLLKNIACSVSVSGCKSFTSATTYTATYKFRVTGTSSADAEVYPVAQIASGTQMKHTGTYPTTITMVPTTSVSQKLTVEKSVDPAYTITHSGGFFNIRYIVKITNTNTADAIVDEVLDNPASGVTLLAGSVKTKDKFRVTETSLNPEPTAKDDLGRYHFGGPFTVAASSSAYVYYVMRVPDPASYPSTTDNVAYGVVGPTLIDASLSTNNVTDCTVTLNSNGTTSNSCTVVTPPKLSQTITFVQPPNQGAGTSYALDATVDSGLDVSYRIVSGPCTLSATTVIYQAQGSCVIEASQAGNSNYDAATPVAQTVTILPQQLITFPQPSSMTTSSTQDVTITASSGLKVTLTSLDTTICKVGGTATTPADSYTPATSGTNVFRITSYTATGNCPLVASQAGDGVLYGAALSVDRTVPVGLSTQVLTTVSPAPPATQSSSTGTVDWKVTPRAGTSSGALVDLPVTYTSQTPSVCTAGDATRQTSGGSYASYVSTISWTQAGVCVVQATQDGINSAGTQSAYGAAEPITISFSIGATPTVTLSSDSAIKSGDSFSVTVVVAKPSGATGAPKGTVTLYTSGDHTSAPVQSGSPLVTNVTDESNKYVFTVDASELPATGLSGNVNLFATYTSVGAVSGETTYNDSQTISSSDVTVYSPAAVLISPSKPTVYVSEAFTATITVIGNSEYGTPAGTVTLTTSSGGTVTSTMPATLNGSGQTVANLSAGTDPSASMVLNASYLPTGASTTYFNPQATSVTALSTRTVEIDPRTYTATFYSNSGSGTMAGQSSNQQTALTANSYTRAGYLFTGWNTAANGTGTPIADRAVYDFLANLDLYAQWSPLPVYTVHFNSNGGSGAMADQSNYEAAALRSNTFTYSGKQFVGWSTVADGSGTDYTDGAQYGFTSDVELFAQWTDLPTHTVTFDSNGGTGSMSEQTNFEAAALTANSFTRAGYAFAGWNSEANGTGTNYGNGAQYSFGADIRLFAKWTLLPRYTVTFDRNGGSGSLDPQINYASAPLVSNTFTRSGYSFAGWNTESDGSGSSYANNAVYDFHANLTLFAQWTALPYHTVVFDGNLGVGSMDNQVGNYAQALSTNLFTRDGYSFTGWNTQSDGSGTGFSNGASYPFTSDTTVYAQWEALPTFTVTFNANGGSGSTGPQTDYTPSALFANAFSRTNYDFVGWNTAADGSGTAYDEGDIYPFTSDVTLFAQWERPMHTVQFLPNLGSGVMSDQTANSTQALNANSFYRVGYGFAGWNSAANGSGVDYGEGSDYAFTNDVILFAQWTPNDYTVSYFAQGGEVSPLSEGFTVGDQALTLPTPTRQGFTFDGWATTSIPLAGIFGSAGDLFTPDGDMSLYAQWTADVYRINYDAQGGTVSPDHVDYVYGSGSIELPSPSREGYDFVGWNELSDGSGAEFGFGGDRITPSGDMTVFARWIPHQYAVAYDPQGGETPRSGDLFTVGETSLTLPGPSREDYAFVGWNTESDGSGTNVGVAGDVFEPTSSVTLYAQWSLIEYTVEYLPNGGNGSMTSQTDHVHSILFGSTFTRVGYSFTGWNTQSDGQGTAFQDEAPFDFTVDLRLYAQWTPDVYTVTFEPQGGEAGVSSVEFTFDTDPLSLPEPTRSGFVFDGWNTEPDGSGTDVGGGGESFSPVADTTLFAQWHVRQFTVHFEPNGGTGTMPDQLESVEVPLASSLFTRDGYSFGGWNTTSDGEGIHFDENAPYLFDADLTLFAQWVPHVYTVTFDPQGGVVNPSTIEYTVGSAPLVLPVATLDGSIFNGWGQTDNADELPVGFDGDEFTPTADTTLYARWSTTLLTQALDGFVWLDLDGDGIQGVDEPSLPGLTLDVTSVESAPPIVRPAAGREHGMSLSATGPSSIVTNMTFRTNADGSYWIGPLGVGNWIIRAVLPQKLTPTVDSDQGEGGEIEVHVSPGEIDSTWMGVRGNSAINAPIFGSDGNPTSNEVILLWEGIDEELLNDDDVHFRTDPDSGMLVMSGMPSGNYRLIRVGATQSDSECVDIVLRDFETFSANIITQKGFDCSPAFDGDLASTGASEELEFPMWWGVSSLVLSLLLLSRRAIRDRRRQRSVRR